LIILSLALVAAAIVGLVLVEHVVDRPPSKPGFTALSA